MITGEDSLSLTKQGSGTFHLIGDQPYTGRTTLNGGCLLMNGSNGASSIVINSGTILGGPGRVGTITAGAVVVSPGDRFGLLRSGQKQISGVGLPGMTYEVHAANDLMRPAWTAIGQANADNRSGAMIFVDPEAPNHRLRFYRFVEP